MKVYSRLRKIKPISYKEEMPMDENKERYPHLNLSLTDLPEAKKWEIGETYEVVLHLKQTSLNARGDKGDVGFDIVKIAVENSDDEANEKEE